MNNFYVVHVGEGLRLERLHLLVDRLRCACEGDAREPVVGHLQVPDSHDFSGHLEAVYRELVISRYGRGANLLAQLGVNANNRSRCQEATHCAS